VNDSLKRELHHMLDKLAVEHDVPGAVLAVMDGGELWDSATGVLNRTTGVETTTDSLFQIGSITKVYTATLVMQLVDEEKVDLDKPLVAYMPGLRLDDPDASAITARHFLTHTSGVDGDFFRDFGRGDDCVARYVAACAALPQMFAPGKMFSYCNAGYVVLGHLVELLSDQTFDAALRSRLLVPLTAPTPITLPEQMLLYRVAAGHTVASAGAEQKVSSNWGLPRSEGPAGATPSARARDVLVFARMHLDRGAAQGEHVISSRSVRAMQQRHVDLPSAVGDEGWGLGWSLQTWSGERVIGHGGATIGQTAYLSIAPERQLAAALLTNSHSSRALYEELFARIFGALRNIDMPKSPEPPSQPAEVDPSAYVGTYERFQLRSEIEARNGDLWLTESPTGEMADLWPDQPPRKLIPADEKLFFMHNAVTDGHDELHFLDWVDGRPRYLYTGRVARRID
jgi:CubicO group peptidase (beta-lactamase class C family)